MARRLFWSALSLALAGCTPSTLAPLQPSHPASPQAAEAPVSPPSAILGLPASDPRGRDLAPADEGGAHHQGHAH
jgi:hypothetical protein